MRSRTTRHCFLTARTVVLTVPSYFHRHLRIRLLNSLTMAPTDPHQGGRLEDMAAEGTTIPRDAGKQRLVGSTIPLNHPCRKPHSSTDPFGPTSRSERSRSRILTHEPCSCGRQCLRHSSWRERSRPNGRGHQWHRRPDQLEH